VEEERAFLFTGLIYQRGFLENCLCILSAQFGPVRLQSESISFDFTSYYEREMGEGLMRKWVLFDTEIEKENIADIKLRTISMESGFSVEEARRVNIDPGYVTLSKVVLPTTKDCAHRIYLKNGIFAEITLMYSKGAWQPQPWTYPDYRSKTAMDFFNKCRQVIAGKER
jgi:hypothetical protein